MSTPATLSRRSTLLLITVASVVVLVTSGRVWVEATYRRWAPLGEVQEVFSGRDIQSVTTVLALLGLAGVGGLLAASGVPRRLVAVVITLAGLAVVFLSVQVAVDPVGALPSLALDDRPGMAGIRPDPVTASLWPWLSALGGAAMAAGGGLAVLRSGSWPSWGAGVRAEQVRRTGDSVQVQDQAREQDQARGQGQAESRDTAHTLAPDAWHAQNLGYDPTEHSEHTEPTQHNELTKHSWDEPGSTPSDSEDHPGGLADPRTGT